MSPEAVFDNDVVRHSQEYLDNRRGQRPTEEYREPITTEWSDFEDHFDKRKIELGSCGRPHGTSSTRRHRPAADPRGVRSMVLFGAGYAVASVSCTLGVLLAVVAQATATGRPLKTVAMFAAYAAGAATPSLAAQIRRAIHPLACRGESEQD